MEIEETYKAIAKISSKNKIDIKRINSEIERNRLQVELEKQIELDKLADEVKVPVWFEDKFDGCTVADMERLAKQDYRDCMKYIEVIKKAGINPCYGMEDPTLTIGG